MRYICSNCGYLQDEIGVSGGCAHDFWGWCIIVTLLISLFYWVGFIVLAFEILFFILTSGKSNCCKKCKAKDCVIPVNTPRGEKIFNEYYEYVEEETEQEEQEQLTGEIETQSDDENDYTFTKIKVQKTKSWKEIAQENRTTLIMIAVGFLILWLVCLALIPLTSSDAKKDIEQAKPVQKTETVSHIQTTQPIKKQTETLENSPQLQAKYKAEIEKAINNGVIKAKKEIDKNYKDSDELYLQIIEQEDYTDENYFKMEIYANSFEGSVFRLYSDLVSITEQYTKHHEDLATGWYGKLAEYIEPTMREYNVSNINKLTDLEKYMSTKYNEIDRRLKGLYKQTYENN